MTVSPTKKPRKPRTSYHHGDLVPALVREATSVVEKEGAEALSVRELARAVGVSPAAPFRHFADRDDLLRAVAHEARLRFLAFAEHEIADAGDDALAQFRALGLAQVRFAIRHPNLQRLLQAPAMREAPTTASEADVERLRAHVERQRGLVSRAQESGSMRSGDPAILELAGVAIVYGLTQLYLEGQLPRDGAESLAEAVIDVLGHGFQDAVAREVEPSCAPLRSDSSPPAAGRSCRRE